MHTKLEVGCDFNNCTSVSSPGANIASPIAMSLIGIVGNAIALVTIHQMKLERQRTVFFVFVAGLAFADLIGKILTTIPVLLVYSHGYYIGGSTMCNYHAFTMITFGVLTPMIACAMALERYFGIRHGYFYMLHFNPQRARMTLLSMWLAAILFSALPIFGFGQYAIQYPGTWCFLNLHPENSVDAAYSITFATINIIFISVMIICNIVVQCTLVVMRCQRKSAGRADRFRRTHRSPQQEELEVQMMFVLLAITIVFTISWTPLQVQILANQFYPHRTAEDHRSDLLAVRLASVNQILDPWVYILCRKLCFRRGCNCWTYVVQKTRLSSLPRSSSQKDFLANSSMRSALVNTRSQSKSNASRHCSRCHPKPVIEENLETNLDCEAMLEGENHLLCSNQNRLMDIQRELKCPEKPNLGSKEAMLPIALAGINGGNMNSSNVPIPIFRSSQYSIQLKKNWHGQRHKKRCCFYAATKSNCLKNVSDVAPSSSDSDEWVHLSNRRRHSWCCTTNNITTKKWCITSHPTITSDTDSLCISG